MAKKRKAKPKPEPRVLIRKFRNKKTGQIEEVDMASITSLRLYKEAMYDINTNHANDIKRLKSYTSSFVTAILEMEAFHLFGANFSFLPKKWIKVWKLKQAILIFGTDFSFLPRSWKKKEPVE